MRIVMVGINHRTAGVELRERVAIAEDRLDGVLDALRDRYPDAEAVLLSTCNRTELYIARPSDGEPSVDQMRQFLAEHAGATLAEVTAASVHREQEPAVRHLVRVCCGLDSMVLGEPQILGQVKRAYQSAAERDGVGPGLHLVFQQAIAAAKKMRTASDVDAGRVSVGAVAVDFARNIFEDFSDKTIVGLGAGEMAKVTLRHLLELEPAHLWVVNRTPQRAIALAETLGLVPPRGGAQPWDQLDDLLVRADVVVCSTGSAQPIITTERFKPLLKKRRGRPLFLIDLAIPRDVDPGVGSLSNVYLYNIDDLQGVLAETADQRAQAAAAHEGELSAAVKSCMEALLSRDVGHLVRELRDQLHAIGEAEQERTRRKLAQAAGDPEQLERVLAEHTHRVVNKILHQPLSRMNQGDGVTPIGFYAAALRRLFGLSDAGTPPQAPPPPSGTPAEPSELVDTPRR